MKTLNNKHNKLKSLIKEHIKRVLLEEGFQVFHQLSPSCSQGTAINNYKPLGPNSINFIPHYVLDSDK